MKTYLLALTLIATSLLSSAQQTSDLILMAGSSRLNNDEKGGTGFSIKLKTTGILGMFYYNVGGAISHFKSETVYANPFITMETSRDFYVMQLPLGVGFKSAGDGLYFTLGADILPSYYLTGGGNNRSLSIGFAPSFALIAPVSRKLHIGLMAEAQFIQSPDKNVSGLGARLIGGGIVFRFL
jgi:hypothetical protein